MANVGSAAAGKTLIGAGNGASPTYASIGTNSGLTAHGVVVAEGSGAFAATAAGTAGQILQSGGGAADPLYSTAVYPSTAGTIGNVLTSDGTNWLSQAPASSGFTTVVTQVFTATGTYTPTSGMKYCIIEAVGGGGGGGGVGVTTGAGAAGSGGAAGSYAYLVASAATIGANQTVTIGTAGTAGSSAGGNGGTGGTTSVGTLVVATGGLGGSGCTAQTPPFVTTGLPGTAPSTSLFSARSPSSFGGIVLGLTSAIGGNGSSSVFGGGGVGETWQSGAGAGPLAGEKGGGGGAAARANSPTGQAGMAGGPGFVKITEFI